MNICENITNSNVVKETINTRPTISLNNHSINIIINMRE